VIIAFGYEHGIPRADKVFDVRELTHNTSDPEFLAKQQEITEYGREHARETIAIGCKQGKHRSVELARRVASALRQSLYLRDSGK
jgi:RNase adaptor protein for sRNA GlmZ degradation